MRVFVTGATGFIGSATIHELINAGHTVLGLARTEAGAAMVEKLGAEPHRGDLENPQDLAAAAATCDGVIHTAFNHDFVDFEGAGKADRLVIEAIGEALAGSNRPFVITSGLAHVSPGQIATEDMAPDPNFPFRFRVPSEEVILGLAPRGVRSSLIRPAPTVHGDGDHGFVPRLIAIAREKRVSAYIGEGDNRWCAVHRLDIAKLFRLALEKSQPGARFHGVAEEGIPTRQIAEAIGRGLKLPVVSLQPAEAMDHFGFLGAFFGMDLAASSAKTRAALGWQPTHKGLIADLDQGTYFEG